MLTEAEKKWLENRNKLDKDGWNYLCDYCENKTDEYHSCFLEVTGGFCPTDSWAQNFRDTAEFEARVARIMTLYLGAPPCGIGKCDNPSFLCPECRLKHARLKAEQEMEE